MMLAFRSCIAAAVEQHDALDTAVRSPTVTAEAAGDQPPLGMSTSADGLHRIVIVGGGASGLELATALGNKLGRRNKAHVTLIDKARRHIWKPLLHEVAAGSMDFDVHGLNYLAQAHWHAFRFRLGELVGVDRTRKLVHMAAYVDEDGTEVTPDRSFPYDTLIIAIGSLSNDFGTPGVKEHALRLETARDAAYFNRRLVNACIRAHAQAGSMSEEQLHVAIIGAGATGVELAAELHNTARQLIAYGLDRIDPDKDVKIHVIEAADRILPGLSPAISQAAAELLRKLEIQTHVSSRVSEVVAGGVKLADGRLIRAEHIVWAAGVKAPDVTKEFGLETNRINQLVVLPTLQTTQDESIFAIGDCAACPWLGREGKTVPPRAQAAHQQASHVVGQIRRRLAGKPLEPFQYRDFGSLVSLSEYATVGNLMGGTLGGSLQIQGFVARRMYISLHKMHELALHGFWKTGLDTLARLITRRTEAHVKLH